MTNQAERVQVQQCEKCGHASIFKRSEILEHGLVCEACRTWTDWIDASGWTAYEEKKRHAIRAN